MKRIPSSVMIILAFCVVIPLAPPFAHAVPAHPAFPQYSNFPSFPDFERDSGIPRPGIAINKIGRVIDGRNLIWGESVGWINLRTTYADVKIGSNILAGWIWLENCGWVCLGNGHPQKGRYYSNLDSYDWGVNNDRHG
ncbi:MAG: hypothetical protein NTZ78_04730, partial [Candidatus Aureabacteria bacterium]|nr:hypothetical protein [Candidatus Auribacterota bacterium]